LVYDVSLVFHYLEYDPANPSNAQEKTVLLPMASGLKNPFLQGGSSTISTDLALRIPMSDFLETVKNAFTSGGNNLSKCPGNVDIMITVGGEAYVKFKASEQSSFGLTGAFNPPNFYTNVTNGLGILSARYNKRVNGFEISQSVKDSLANNFRTRNLGFVVPTSGTPCH
jgi:hypothetical protein